MRAPRITPEQSREIARRYRSGESGTSMAQARGMSVSVVYRALEGQGVPRFYKLSPGQQAAILAAVARGESQRAMARQYDVAPSTICRLVKKHKAKL